MANEVLSKELVDAAKLGDPKKIKELLHRGADVHHVGGWDVCTGVQTALFFAAEAGHVLAAQAILDHGEEEQDELDTALKGAALRGHVVIVQMLLEKGADPSVDDNYVLRYAAQYGRCSIVQLLLNDPRVDPAATGNFGLLWASYYGHVDVVRLLLSDHRVDPCAQNNSAACWAAQNERVDVLHVLLADERVDATRAIAKAGSRAVHVLFEDERCGIHVNRTLFERYQWNEVMKYEKREAAMCAASWCMKHIGEDLREPTEERMRRLPLE